MWRDRVGMWKMVTLLLLFVAIGVHIVEGRGPVHANGTIPEQVHIAATGKCFVCIRHVTLLPLHLSYA